MKRKILFISSILLIILIGGCVIDTKKVNMEKSNSTDIKASENIVGVLKDRDITSKTEELKFVFTNNGDEEYTFDREPYLEKEIDNQWYRVPVLMKVQWNDISVLLPSENNFEETINLHDYYGKLQKGKYRYIKRFYYNIEEEDVIIEFNIK